MHLFRISYDIMHIFIATLQLECDLMSCSCNKHSRFCAGQMRSPNFCFSDCTKMGNQQLSGASSKFQMSESDAEWEMERPALKCQQSQLLDNMPDAAAAICMTKLLHFVFVWLCVLKNRSCTFNLCTEQCHWCLDGQMIMYMYWSLDFSGYMYPVRVLWVFDQSALGLVLAAS